MQNQVSGGSPQLGNPIQTQIPGTDEGSGSQQSGYPANSIQNPIPGGNNPGQDQGSGSGPQIQNPIPGTGSEGESGVTPGPPGVGSEVPGVDPLKTCRAGANVALGSFVRKCISYD